MADTPNQLAMIAIMEKQLISFDARKRHGFSQDFGTAHFGFTLFGLFNRFAGIYSMWTKPGIRKQRRSAFYWTSNPQTPAQTVRRDKFRLGVVAWQALTEPQKQAYNKRARSKRLSRFNLFMSEYMRS